MNNSQNNSNIKNGMEEVDDLTRFLDEDFATDAVDLFEFTSEEDSPLTRLKSIILSLDWEITDEILQDLNEEIDHLKHLDQFAHDKVSQVYLQGLDKIGKYIQNEGASAHPNSIKLLLTLYYDFEKILSSEHITGAEITALLKADVRKFKILQHQIAQRHGTAAVADEEVSAPLPLTEHKDLQGIQAAILELDWEVTDRGLNNLAEQLNILKAGYAGDRYLQVVIQGLHALNSYIMEEKGRAHPETFSLLHNFYDALETLVEQQDLDDGKRQEILIDCVNRLNNLKNLIAQTYPTEDLAPEAITPVTEPEEAEDESLLLETETPSGKDESTAGETAEEPEPEKHPGEEVFPESSQEAGQTAASADAAMTDLEELDKTFAEEAGIEITPALADSLEEGGFGRSGDLEEPPEELEEKLEFFFGGDKEEFAPEAIEEAVAARKAEEQPVDLREPEEAEDEIAPALAGSVEKSEFGVDEANLESPSEELEEKLASFFGEGEAPAGEPPAAAGIEQEEDVPGVLTEEEDIVPALADTEGEAGFASLGSEIESPSDELTERLESFFGEEEAPAGAMEEQKPPAVFAAEQEQEPAPALAGSGEETGFIADAEMEASSEELERKLDFFFGDEEEMTAAKAEEETGSEEEVLLTEALEETAGENIFKDDEPAQPAVTTESGAETMSPEEYQAVVEQMKAEFSKMENALRLEISSLKQEVESLRVRLGS
jgi:pilus assembly protein FimV